MKWNTKGTAVLLITMTDVDKTGKSDYGKTMLHYLDTKGTTATVQTDTDAPVIHAAEWSPMSNEFCVSTGKMPMMVTHSFRLYYLRKLEQIHKLKEQQAMGKILEKNQIDKIATEDALVKEIKALELKSS